MKISVLSALLTTAAVANEGFYCETAGAWAPTTIDGDFADAEACKAAFQAYLDAQDWDTTTQDYCVEYQITASDGSTTCTNYAVEAEEGDETVLAEHEEAGISSWAWVYLEAVEFVEEEEEVVEEEAEEEADDEEDDEEESALKIATSTLVAATAALMAL